MNSVVEYMALLHLVVGFIGNLNAIPATSTSSNQPCARSISGSSRSSSRSSSKSSSRSNAPISLLFVNSHRQPPLRQLYSAVISHSRAPSRALRLISGRFIKSKVATEAIFAVGRSYHTGLGAITRQYPRLRAVRANILHSGQRA